MRKKYVNTGNNKKLSKSKTRSKTLIIVGILVVVSIAGSIGAYSAMSSNGDSREEEKDVGKGTSSTSNSNSNIIGTWHDIHGVGLFSSGEDSSLYLATHNGLFNKKSDNSSGWTQVGSDKSDLMGFVISPTIEGVMYSSGHPSSMNGNLGFRKSTDGGITWQTISPVRNPPVDFHAMAASPVDENLLYGAPGGGDSLYVTHDEGKTWTTAEVPPGQIISLAAHPRDSNFVYAGTTSGLFFSSEQGKNWQKIDLQYVQGSSSVTGLGFATDGRNTLYAFVIPESDDDDGYIVKSTDGAKTWTKTSGQIPGAKAAWKFSFSRTGEVYTIVNQDAPSGGIASSVYRSNDDGKSWVLEGTNKKTIAG
jgi:photosystem II stability/assembly factor-like uncharacterized protein